MLSRRALLVGGVATFAAPAMLARAQNSTDSAGEAPTILRLERRNIEVNGKTASVYGIRQPNRTFGVTTEVGKPFRVRVENGIDEPSLIHWHGLTPPWRQDGVPGISGPPIPAGGSADYDFPLRFGGTFWMHSHQGLQEQRLMTAPLIIHDQRDRPDEQEVVVMLADFSFTPGEQMFENLRKSDSMVSMAKPTAPMASMSGMKMAAPMSTGQSGPDLNDVKYDAFLANFRTLADPEIVKAEPGGRLLLRIINGSSMSAFHVGLGALDGELIAVDGFEVEPIRGHEFPVAVAQRLDIRVSLPPGPGAYPVLAQLRASVSKPESSWSQAALRSAEFPMRRRRRHRRSRSISNGACGPKSRWFCARPTASIPSTSPARWPVMCGHSTTWSGTKTRRPSPSLKESGSSLCSSTRRRCRIRCICMGMSSRW
jgi:FtsP/CotA-like multicopper oxidase with cupredoxin domain